MRRVGVFVFYDFENKWDSYVDYLLDSICPLLSKLIIVLNSKLDEQKTNELEKWSDLIIERENVGFDAGAYKDVILKLGVSFFQDYDQLIFFNDTFYGPIYPWNNMFDTMEKQKADFGGITRLKNSVKKDGTLDPERLQSYF